MSVQNLQSDSDSSVAGDSLGLFAASASPVVEVRQPGGSRGVRGGSSWIASSFIVVNAALGAGLLNFPYAFNAAGGIVVALVIQAALMVFIVGSLIILAYCSDMNQSATYQDVVFSMCGKRLRTLCSLTVALYCFGTCITFIIIIGDQWDKFLSKVYDDRFCLTWYMNRQFTMSVTSVIFILPLCFPKTIDFLKYASALGVLGVLYVVALVTVKYFIGPIHPGPIKTSPTRWTDVFNVIPVICFGYQCHVSVVPVYSCLKKRTLKEFSKTLSVAMLICIGSYSLPAIFGYLTFGSNVSSDILTSYSPHPEVLVAVVMIAAKIYTTYPILLFVGRAALDSLLIDVFRLSPESVMTYEKKRRVIITVTWFSVSLLLATLIPNISDVISVLGSLAALFIFVYPGMCLLQLLMQGYVHPVLYKTRYRLLLVLSILFLIIGAFIFGVTATQAIWTDATTSTVSHTKGKCI